MPSHASPESQLADDSRTPKRHRPRVGAACDACRRRKTRCDGRQPICYECERRSIGHQCAWDHPRRRTLKRTAQDRSPEQERRTTSNTEPPVILPLGQVNHERPLPISNGVQPSSAASNQHLHQNYQRAPTLTTTGYDAALAVRRPPAARSDGLATLTSGNDSSLYGASSTIAFMRDAFSRRTSPSPGPARSTDFDPKAAFRLVDANASAIQLPSRQDADNFISCYFSFIHPLFPVLHKPTFLHQYEYRRLREEEPLEGRYILSDVEEAIMTATFNLVFALGCQFSDLVIPANKPSLANDYYQRSRRLLLFEILDATSLPLVQMLLLTGVYLQSTQHANRCWNAVGLAIRVAQSLGLHVNDLGRRPPPQLEREMRRRVWHTCVNLDRLLAMTFGRPTMLSKPWNVPTPVLVNDEYLSETVEGTQPEGIPCALGLFVSSCQLFDLLEEILSSFYSGDASPDFSKQGNAHESPQRLIEPVLQFNRRLDRFAQSVPSYLKFGAKSNMYAANDNSVQLQQQVLYCRFLYIRLLSLRPLLMVATKSGARAHLISGTEQTSLDDEVVSRCCNLCAETASSLVATIHQHLNTLYRSSGWHSVYFTFSSAMVMLASCKSQVVSLSLGDHSFEADWARCLSILRHYEEQISSAAQAIRVLEALKQQLYNQLAMPSRNVAAAPTDNTQIPANEQAIHGINAADLTNYPLMAYDFGLADPFGAEGMSEAWFGQQLVNLDWLEMPMPIHSQ